MQHLKTAVVVFTLMAASAIPALAHHAFSSEFDAKKPVKLSGTVTGVDWTKPHAYLHLNAKNASGSTEEWKLEAASPDTLESKGLSSDTFKGKTVTVNAYLATGEEHVASARIVNIGGTNVEVCDPKEDKGPAK